MGSDEGKTEPISRGAPRPHRARHRAGGDLLGRMTPLREGRLAQPAFVRPADLPAHRGRLQADLDTARRDRSVRRARRPVCPSRVSRLPTYSPCPRLDRGPCLRLGCLGCPGVPGAPPVPKEPGRRPRVSDDRRLRPMLKRGGEGTAGTGDLLPVLAVFPGQRHTRPLLGVERTMQPTAAPQPDRPGRDDPSRTPAEQPGLASVVDLEARFALHNADRWSGLRAPRGASPVIRLRTRRNKVTARAAAGRDLYWGHRVSTRRRRSRSVRRDRRSRP